MKKIITLIVCLAMALSLAACAQNQEGETLLVGYGRRDITPEFSVPLHGYSDTDTRRSSEVLDSIYATCVAFTDGDDNTVLLFHTDLGTAFHGAFTLARAKIAKKTGIPASNIMVSATHQHSGPALREAGVVIEKYTDYMIDLMIEAAEEAMADRKAARMYMADTELVGMNFVRHYRMDDGSVVGDNFGDPTGKQYMNHVSAADNQMQLLRITRDGGKDVVLVNWQTHPHRVTLGRTESYYAITSDIVGSMRDYVEAQMDCSFAYFSGASGNIDPKSRMGSENVTDNYLEQGREMGRYAVMACDNMTPVNAGKVEIISDVYNVVAEVDGEHNMELFAFRVGNLGFICAPYEMFDTNGVYIKENSPFDMTFIVTYANNSHGYVAAESAYAYGGYEVEYKRYPKGTGEALATKFVEMLNRLDTQD